MAEQGDFARLRAQFAGFDNELDVGVAPVPEPGGGWAEDWLYVYGEGYNPEFNLFDQPPYNTIPQELLPDGLFVQDGFHEPENGRRLLVRVLAYYGSDHDWKPTPSVLKAFVEHLSPEYQTESGRVRLGEIGAIVETYLNQFPYWREYVKGVFGTLGNDQNYFAMNGASKAEAVSRTVGFRFRSYAGFVKWQGELKRQNAVSQERGRLYGIDEDLPGLATAEVVAAAMPAGKHPKNKRRRLIDKSEALGPSRIKRVRSQGE